MDALIQWANRSGWNKAYALAVPAMTLASLAYVFSYSGHWEEASLRFTQVIELWMMLVLVPPVCVFTSRVLHLPRIFWKNLAAILGFVVFMAAFFVILRGMQLHEEREQERATFERQEAAREAAINADPKLKAAEDARQTAFQKMVDEGAAARGETPDLTVQPELAKPKSQ